MKKRILYFAAALMMLCSCAGKNPDSGSTVVPTSSVPSSDSEVLSEDLHLLTSNGVAGKYLLEQQGDNQLLCYIDYDQAVEVPLCTSPSCAHDSERCTAWIPSGEFASSLVAVNEDTIAFISNSAEGAQQIEVADAGGANRRVLYTAASGQYLESLACADQAALYCLLGDLSEDTYQIWLYRIPLDGTDAEPIRVYPDSAPELKGVLGRNLVLYQYTWGDTPEEAEANGGDHRLFLWNIDTGEEQELDVWHSQAGSNGRSVCWQDGQAYWCSSDTSDAIHWLDAQGQSGQVDVVWPAEITGAPETTFTLERVINGHALITVWGPWGTDLLKRYAVELSVENAVPTEIPLRYVSNASERPIEILGEKGDELLVCFVQQDQINTQIQSDGYLSQDIEITNRYGIISWEDFLAGTPNYREVTAG